MKRHQCFVMSLIMSGVMLLMAFPIFSEDSSRIAPPQNQEQRVLCPRIYLNGVKLTTAAQDIPARFNNRVDTYSCYWLPSPGASIHTGIGAGNQAVSNACPPGEVVNQVHLYRRTSGLDVWFGVQVECCSVQVQIPQTRVEYVWVPLSQCP